MTTCTVVDYGSGNLFSVCRAIEHCGGEVELTGDGGRILSAERILLPGVGAFGDAMTELRRRDLIDPLCAFAETGRPFLGICIGMQLMFDRSEEFGDHDGLSLIPGWVRAIPKTTAAGRPHKVPHTGWNRIAPAEGGGGWAGTILDGLNGNSSCYFVHSFTAEPADDAVRVADADYDGVRIAACVCRGALWGCQFHPEKSGPVGLRIIDNFLRLPAAPGR